MSDNPIYDKIAAHNANHPDNGKSLKPEPKVAAAGIAGAVTVLVVFAVNLIWPDVEIPNEVAAAFTAIVAFAAGYIKS